LAPYLKLIVVHYITHLQNLLLLSTVCTLFQLSKWTSCPDIITKDQWPPNSSNINPMDYHVWDAMLEAYRKLKTKPKTSAELKEALQVIWGNPPQGPIDKVVKDFSNKGLEAAVVAWSWRWTLRTFAVTKELLFDYYLTALFNDANKLVL